MRRHFLPNWTVRTSGARGVDLLYSLRVAPPPARRGLRSYHLLYLGSQRLERTLDLDQIFEAFDQSLHLSIATTAGPATFVHAGVVGWRGKAILIPGRTRAGKSTLVKALVDRGATFYSDEFAVLDADGRAHAYPRELSLRGRGGKTLIPAGELGWDRSAAPLPVGAVISTRFEKRGRFAPKPLVCGQAMLELFSNAIAVRSQPVRDLAALAKAASSADLLLMGERGEAKAAARSIMDALDA